MEDVPRFVLTLLEAVLVPAMLATLLVEQLVLVRMNCNMPESMMLFLLLD